MSTKIYEAYKLKPNCDLWATCTIIRDTAIPLIMDKLTTVYRRSKADYSDRDWYLVHKYITASIEQQAGSAIRNPFDIDVYVRIYLCNSNFYLVPYCDRVSIVSGSLDFLKTLPSLEDFSYWNNMDRPDHVSEDEWDHRSDIWNEIFEKDIPCLILSISNVMEYYKVSPLTRLLKESYIYSTPQ